MACGTTIFLSFGTKARNAVAVTIAADGTWSYSFTNESLALIGQGG